MEETTPQGEFHHFQLVNTNGEVPVSISILVHYNPQPQYIANLSKGEPITVDDVLSLHNELEVFDGDFIKAFSTGK